MRIEKQHQQEATSYIVNNILTYPLVSLQLNENHITTCNKKVTMLLASTKRHYNQLNKLQVKEKKKEFQDHFESNWCLLKANTQNV